ncbi:3'-5' exoribonuclease YhaM family protein [Desulfurispira natronophila]|uniref:3'-5' exoribonuclease n=1 Tax=Desulfurispira natronophila TaxID=682562 RepID=A0A7W8DGI2_9BACT|nr:HD domain-containing protein [Desulfurispira natronophila]MBB5021389.1 3'-5' exoribonuclease [Desulfurispira natronophila]
MFIGEFEAGKVIHEDLLVTQHAIRQARNGKDFQFLKLQDRTGQIDGYNWNYQAGGPEFRDGQVVTVKASVQEFKGNLQLNIATIAPSGAAFDRDKFLPSTCKDINALYSELENMIARVENTHLKKLLVAVTQDPEIKYLLQTAPAAKNVHHATLGGLLEHTVSVMGLALRVCPHYPQVNQDKVLAGAFFHDIGKIRELEYKTAFEYSTPGMLLGHLYIGCEIFERFVRKFPHFPPDLATEIKHIILSHHGYLEFGSPKRPKTMEAFIVHHMDDLDARISIISDAFASNPGGPWSDYHRLMERRFYRGAEHENPAVLQDNSPQPTPPAAPSVQEKTKPSAARKDFAQKPFENLDSVLPFGKDDD